MGALLSLMSIFFFFRVAFPIQREVANSLRGFVEFACQGQIMSCHHGPVGCGDAATPLVAYSNFLRVDAQLTPRSANSDADRMGERRNTMGELVDKIGRHGEELAR
jgi:hypothetical protein